MQAKNMEGKNYPLKVDTPVVSTAFADVAKRIIYKAFRSAICIDDEYASAYSEEEGLNTHDPRALYNSFREEGFCDLDIHHFKSMSESWRTHMLENKELMILDWELDPGQRYDSTLEILINVVSSNKIPFIVIYTNTGDINVVAKKLIEKFNPITTAQYEAFIAGFANLKHICNDEVDFDTLKEADQGLFFSYVHEYSRRDAIAKEICSMVIKTIPVKDEHKDKLIDRIITNIKNVFKISDELALLYLSYLALRDDQVYDTLSLTRVETSEPAYIINGSVTILVFHKQGQGGIAPNSLFTAFSNAIVHNPHNFLSLLALEFKDNIKENFNKIGAKFSALNEDAFFYHMENYKKEDGNYKIGQIYDFILKGWLSELHQQKVTEKSEVLDYLPERAKDIVIDKDSPGLTQNLIRYSAYISTTDLSLKPSKKLWFGDIFKNTDGEYFLCITPQCDCVRPTEKIKNNFYFVKGTLATHIENALRDAEKDFYSFIIEGGKTICVLWKCKPFTTFIRQPLNNSIDISYSGKSGKVQYLTSLKENYTQRISNEAFGYGYRVGIDLPHFHNSAGTKNELPTEV